LATEEEICPVSWRSSSSARADGEIGLKSNDGVVKSQLNGAREVLAIQEKGEKGAGESD